MDYRIAVEVGRVPQRRAEQIQLAFDATLVEGKPAIVAVDAADGAFVRLVGLPALPDPGVSGLSADGRKILLRPERDKPAEFADLRLLDLSARQESSFALRFASPRYYVAGLSPDGTQIAVLSDDDQAVGYEGDGDNRVHLHVVDVATGAWTRRWTSPGEAWVSWECGVDWSPDGTRIAATHMFFDYEDSHDDWNAIVVLDSAGGAPLRRIDFHEPIGWIDDDNLIMLSPEPGLTYTVLDVSTGSTRTVEMPSAPEASAAGAIAAANGRIIGSWGYNEPPHNAFFHTDAFGHDLRPLFTVDARQPRLFPAARYL